jgi:hypothetical protein
VRGRASLPALLRASPAVSSARSVQPSESTSGSAWRLG